MTSRYRFDPAQSRFTVQAFAAGVLSFLGHSPTFAVREFGGELTAEGATVTGVRLTVRSGSLQLADQVSASDRREIEATMFRDVLGTERYPEIAYAADAVTASAADRGQYLLHVAGRLSLHGVTRPQPVDAEMLVFDDGIRLRGEAPLRLSDYDIRPVTALAGTIRLKDGLALTFDLAGLPEEA